MLVKPWLIQGREYLVAAEPVAVSNQVGSTRNADVSGMFVTQLLARLKPMEVRQLP
jgi:hypothetical protein